MKTFESLSLASEVQKALRTLQFTIPTPVQNAVLEAYTSDSSEQDLLVSAETGSGKTAAYGIPLVSRLIEDKNKTALVLAPTRELAFQIESFLKQLTAFCTDIRVLSLVGGMDIRRQFKGLAKKPRVIVATPGRMIDHLKRKSGLLKSTGVLVLDEGDRMLDMGFSPQLKKIVSYLPKDRHSSLFSATLPKKVQGLASDYLKAPGSISIGQTALPVASIKQSVVSLKKRDEKEKKLEEELHHREGSVIIFSRTKRGAEKIAKGLRKSGFSAGFIHGDCRQAQRIRTLKEFKTGKIRILSATDVAARGIDVAQVGHVVNYDLPMNSDDYVHRIGRTARNGESGEAISFVLPDESRAWNQLVRRYKIKDAEIPTSSNEKRRGRFKKKRRKASQNFRLRRKRPSKKGSRKLGS